MPLVVMCGFPASGKTTRCREIYDYLSAQYPSKQVHIVSDEQECVSKKDMYTNSHKEREMRGNLKSSVQRLLGKEDIVILDSLNYIKGFRYELFCVSKSSRTTHCVVYCITDAETSKMWNSLRAEGERYPEEVIDELIMRFEFPSSGNRWDKPLFSVVKDGSLDIATICTTLFEQKALIPNQSTQTQPLSSTNFLYEMDRITQDIITTLATAQKSLCPGDKIKIKDSREDITFTRPFSMAELQRHRRQFISYTKMHPVEDTSKLSNLFVQYLNKSLQN
ncbi:protein KTI12 [Biomphalaria pfeifferi]|uniref:Protein KTI12 homolog n=1 Tax=Biomphalaria pfeifferi TaxID=112525 RepID=A0AAD8EY89_BIOPF|nr:protein KTI12 [Biomphalaria pfeifferi]